MAVEIINDTILKPSPSSPPNAILNSQIPLTIFDRAAFDLHVNILYAYRPPMPSNEAIIEGLSQVLNHFPHLAGRLTVDKEGRPCVLLNNAGIRLVETRVGTTLAERLPFNPSHELTKLHPPIEGNIDELLQIQLNRYTCGGLVIGQTAHHRVADGQSMSSFFLAWAKLVRGLAVDPLPYHDRAAISVPRNPPFYEFNHRAIEFREEIERDTSANTSSSSIVNLVIHFSHEFVTKVKTHVIGTDVGHRYSTFECMLAHLWKKITIARGLDDDELTQVRVAVNGRGRIKPAVPLEYFGNLVLWAYPRLRVKDLLNESHVFVAKAIHEAVAKVDNAYFKSFVDFGELSKGEDGGSLVGAAPDVGNLLCPNMEVDSWMRFQFHDLDFGGGGPCAFLPAELPVEGLLIFVPSCKEKGGVDAFMALQQEHVDHFKQIAHSLD
ncbi:agmatine coumaroyltransferase-2-like protein [Cinnamomum micranthum f. kanehirae]|uniref:Agmatine coumaroyltransferase-2-like protein n=1 Tax=Cinnamomum micranthum f. kanehirae TaxID=337451 RepID=A0A3S3N8K2_9MAGN|nr:agmatine coumaroyltransferase-2-like protein [Cinnamomum micranthum f. kanehirae]